MMNKILTIIIVCLIGTTAFGQNPKFDKLEMLFEQGHYKRVYRKSKRLIDNPAYDFSYLPKYYKSLSLLQLSQNEHWNLLHKDALRTAKELFLEVKRSEDSEQIFNSHMYELTWVKNDMLSWAADLKRRNLDSDFNEAQALIDELFSDVEIVVIEEPAAVVEIDTVNVNPASFGFRDEILITAKEQLGVPYVWAGSTPEGFDCSGFTSYVMKQNGKSLPRRASEQYEDSKRVKPKNVERGDLVFFNNGSGISHVGIVVSKKNEPVHMIHSSSSKGVIITDISKSDYWKQRLHGFGTYAD